MSSAPLVLGRQLVMSYLTLSEAQKNPPLVSRPLKGGGGEGRATNETKTFFETLKTENYKKKFRWPLRWREGGIRL